MTTHTLDITKDHCPMTFVKVRLKLDEIPKEDQLAVLLLKGEPLDNIPKTVIEYGFQVLEINEIAPETYRVLIQK